MGHDEHGPAYPEPPQRATECRGSGCLQALLPPIIGVLVGLAFVAFVLRPAHAMDHGFDPLAPTTKWMERLQRPQPNGPVGPCCGVADAYQADTYVRHRDGSYTVTITDGSEVEFPDGQRRDPLPDGTVIEVPADHVNPPREQSGNPTGHAWLFISVYSVYSPEGKKTYPGTTYCFVPLPDGT